LRRIRRPEANTVYEKALDRMGETVLVKIRALISGPVLSQRTGRYFKSFETDTNRPHDYIDVGSPEPRIVAHEFGFPGKGLKKRAHVEPGVLTSVSAFAAIWDSEFERAATRGRSA